MLVLTDDDLTNIEAALTARAANPACSLVIRTDDARLRESVAHLIPGARPLGVLALAAQAFAAASLGENVLELLQLDGRTVLMIEYRVEATDTLVSKLIGEVAYGFGVVPLLLRRDARSEEFFPSDDARLREHDDLIVLTTVEGLRDIEHGAIRPALHRVCVDGRPPETLAFEAALMMARVSGCDVGVAQSALKSAPSVLDVPLYRPQAERLARELTKVGIEARSQLQSATPMSS